MGMKLCLFHNRLFDKGMLRIKGGKMRYFGGMAPVVKACRNLAKDQFKKFYGKFESELNSVIQFSL